MQQQPDKYDLMIKKHAGRMPVVILIAAFCVLVKLMPIYQECPTFLKVMLAIDFFLCVLYAIGFYILLLLLKKRNKR